VQVIQEFGRQGRINATTDKRLQDLLVRALIAE
jgi:hypothetical protein